MLRLVIADLLHGNHQMLIHVYSFFKVQLKPIRKSVNQLHQVMQPHLSLDLGYDTHTEAPPAS